MDEWKSLYHVGSIGMVTVSHELNHRVDMNGSDCVYALGG